jgi:hypothetical protein
VVLACKVPGGFDPEATAPAPVDCDGAPKAHVTADAISVEIDATSPTVDVALVPGGGDTWHLGFESPTAVATYDVVASPPQPTSMPTATPRRATFATSSPLAGTPMALPPITVAPPAAVGRDIADAARAAVTAPPVVGATAVPTGGGFRYAVVFALPLVLLVVIGALGHGLTRPVRLREDAA